jgi:hypothetical protein
MFISPAAVSRISLEPLWTVTSWVLLYGCFKRYYFQIPILLSLFVVNFNVFHRNLVLKIDIFTGIPFVAFNYFDNIYTFLV